MRHLMILEGANERDIWERVIVPSMMRKYWRWWEEAGKRERWKSGGIEKPITFLLSKSSLDDDSNTSVMIAIQVL